MYVPAREIRATPNAINIKYDDVRIKTDEGGIIAGWYIPVFDVENIRHDPLSDCTVLICHGNAGNISDRLDLISAFHKMNMNIFIFDYSGYGDSTGTPSEERTEKDALTAWKYLTGAKGLSPDSILVYGRSLGGAIATALAEKVNPSALVLEATFTSAKDMARERFSFFPVSLCRYNYNTIERIKKINCPVVVAHCREDNIVPYEHGVKVFEAANKPKLFVELHASHVEGMESDMHYQRELRRFLISHFVHHGI